MSSAIEINNLQKSFGSVQALRGLNLKIREGEFFGLLGPNGAGKSTLINIIAGLTRLDSGEVSVMGHDVLSDYRQARAAVGVVPQELVFDPFFTVREVLLIQAGYFGLGREQAAWIDYLLEALMLTDKANSNMRSLSGGMKRRVLIAQALVHKPRVVVLDEPTAGVDVELRSSLWRFVQQLHREGHTIVLTTHYLEEAESLCERIAIINHGELIALDDTAALLAQGRGYRLLRITLGQPLAQLPEALLPKVKLHEALSLELQLERDGETLIEVLDLLRASGAEVVDIKSEEADLEDLFLELTAQSSR